MKDDVINFSLMLHVSETEVLNHTKWEMKNKYLVENLSDIKYSVSFFIILYI